MAALSAVNCKFVGAKVGVRKSALRSTRAVAVAPVQAKGRDVFAAL